MGLEFLFNAAGAAATSIGNTGSGSTASGYSTSDIITGPRSTCWRSTSSTLNSIGYAYATSLPITHVVVARADWLVTKAGQRVKGRQAQTGSVWSDITGFDFNPLTAASLIGPTSQDLVVPTVPAHLFGIGLSFVPTTGSEASQFSKLYGCNSFSFADAVPSFGGQYSPREPGEYLTSFRGTLPYEVERTFSLRFVGVTLSEWNSLIGMPNFYHWPFYIYDSGQHLWDWKLEHVLLTGVQMSPLDSSGNLYAIELQLARLRHYD